MDCRGVVGEGGGDSLHLRGPTSRLVGTIKWVCLDLGRGGGGGAIQTGRGAKCSQSGSEGSKYPPRG